MHIVHDNTYVWVIIGNKRAPLSLFAQKKYFRLPLLKRKVYKITEVMTSPFRSEVMDPCTKSVLIDLYDLYIAMLDTLY